MMFYEAKRDVISRVEKLVPDENKVIMSAIMVVCAFLISALQGCATYYTQLHLPDDQIATICGSITEFDREHGEISSVGITMVDSVSV